MSAKINILPAQSFNNVFELSQPLASLLVNRQITRTQYLAVLSICADAYPCQLSLDQRTPREMLYLSVNGAAYTINNRAKIKCEKV